MSRKTSFQESYSILEILIKESKEQYGAIYDIAKVRLKPAYFVKNYILKNNDRAENFIELLSGNNSESKKNMKEGIINILIENIESYKKYLDNKMDMSGGYKKSSKSKPIPRSSSESKPKSKPKK